MALKRIEREKAVVGQMIAHYCKRTHHSAQGELCKGCRKLLDYACKRLDRCPHGSRKKSCSKCAVRCYSPEHRRRIRLVMKTIGPRMLLINPLAALRHLLS